MWFGSWTHPQPEIDLDLAFSNGIDLSTFNNDYKVKQPVAFCIYTIGKKSDGTILTNIKNALYLWDWIYFTIVLCKKI